jgi:hypothetical protein
LNGRVAEMICPKDFAAKEIDTTSEDDLSAKPASILGAAAITGAALLL